MIEIRCDICKRLCSDYYVLSAKDAAGHVVDIDLSLDQETLHICKPRDGGDVGCAGFFKQGLSHAQRQAHSWVTDHRP